MKAQNIEQVPGGGNAVPSINIGPQINKPQSKEGEPRFAPAQTESQLLEENELLKSKLDAQTKDYHDKVDQLMCKHAQTERNTQEQVRQLQVQVRQTEQLLIEECSKHLQDAQSKKQLFEAQLSEMRSKSQQEVAAAREHARQAEEQQIEERSNRLQDVAAHQSEVHALRQQLHRAMFQIQHLRCEYALRYYQVQRISEITPHIIFSLCCTDISRRTLLTDLFRLLYGIGLDMHHQHIMERTENLRYLHNFAAMPLLTRIFPSMVASGDTSIDGFIVRHYHSGDFRYLAAELLTILDISDH